MNSQQFQEEPLQRRPLDPPRKNPKNLPCKSHDGQRPASIHLERPESSTSVNVEPKRKRGRPRKALSALTSTSERFLPERAETPSTLGGEGTKERPVRTFRHVSPGCKGSFSALTSVDRYDFTLLQVERIQGDPEEVIYLTDSDEEVDDSTDVEEGDFEGAQRRRRIDKIVEQLREHEFGRELDSVRRRRGQAKDYRQIRQQGTP